MEIVDFFILLFLGLGVGVLSAFFGVGGGAFLVPALIGIWGLSWPVANAISLVQMVPTSARGAWLHWKNKNIVPRLALLSLIGSMPGAWLGKWIVKSLGDQGMVEIGSARVDLLNTVLTWGLASTIFIMSWKLLSGDKNTLNDEAPPIRPELVTPGKAIGLGLVVGIASAMLGIGGGFLFVPLAIQMFELPVVVAVGTSLFQMPFTAFAGAAAYLTDTKIPYAWIVPLLIGSLTGVGIGIWLSKRYSNKQYKHILVGMTCVISCWLIYQWIVKIEWITN